MSVISVAVDHRSRLGRVKDQGQRPTCLAHAATSAHEATRGSPLPLSPEYLHWFAAPGPAKGANFDGMVRALRDHGQPLEAHCPYLPSGPPTTWSPPAVPVFRRESEEADVDVTDLMALIGGGITPVLVIKLPESFYRPDAPWVISARGRVRGTHAVVGVGAGLDGTEGSVLVRNSWGPEWGDEGHAWLNSQFLKHHLLRILVLTSEVTGV